jgi:hypothetical protein
MQPDGATQPQPSLLRKALMPFESISRQRFDAFQPPHLILQRLTVEQVEWFTNTVGNIIGTIAGKVDNGWSYAVLKGDRNGNYRVCTLGGDTFSLRAARSRFLLDMEAAEKAEEELARLERRKTVANPRP